MFSRTSIPSRTIKNNSSLQEEIEEFLKNGGGIRKLKNGESTATVKIGFNNSTSQRKPPQHLKSHVVNSSPKTTPNKTFKSTPNTTKLKSNAKARIKTITPEEQAKKERIIAIKVAKLDAIAKGLKRFIAPCTHHGTTIFNLSPRNAARCTVCISLAHEQRVAERKLNEEEIRLITNHHVNKNLAIMSGQDEFTSHCPEHGQTTFVIKSKFTKCIKCDELRKTTLEVKKSKSKRPPKRSPEEQERRRKIQKAKSEAVALKLEEFIGPCIHHGLSTFTLSYTDLKRPKARCNKCMTVSLLKNNHKNAKQLTDLTKEDILKKEVEFNRKRNNRLKMIEALQNNKDRFIGVCSNHGVAPHIILKSPRARKLGATYTCMECLHYTKIKSDLKNNRIAA